MARGGGKKAAALGPASESVRAANDRLRELLSRKTVRGSEADRKVAEQVTSELRGLLDLDDLTRRALVDHWDKMTVAQRGAVTTTLREIIERRYIKDLRDNLDYRVDYKGETAADGGAMLVKTVIHAKKNARPVKIRVEYLTEQKAGAWRVVDVVTDDVSLVKNYRSQFNRIISKEGVDGLIARMRNKLAEAERT
jgi:phospholipid transport system substrate-binding protein